VKAELRTQAAQVQQGRITLSQSNLAFRIKDRQQLMPAPHTRLSPAEGIPVERLACPLQVIASQERRLAVGTIGLYLASVERLPAV
jgi:hypothetical protein